MYIFEVHYGVMGSGKSLELLRRAYNFRESGLNVQLLTSGLDDRSGTIGLIDSRISGMGQNATTVTSDVSAYDILKELDNEQKIDIIMIDEGQFFSKQNVLDISRFARENDVKVYAYLLKNDFMNNMFEGTKHFFLHASSITEIKSICMVHECDEKAVMNLRIQDGKAVREGVQIEIGHDDRYISVCPKHYYSHE